VANKPKHPRSPPFLKILQPLVDAKKITIIKDQTLLDALKENFKIEEKSGFITSIDGKSQDQAANKYWLFDVNGKMADKGAADIHLIKKVLGHGCLLSR
jgi:hypothetical protein